MILSEEEIERAIECSMNWRMPITLPRGLVIRLLWLMFMGLLAATGGRNGWAIDFYRISIAHITI